MERLLTTSLRYSTSIFVEALILKLTSLRSAGSKDSALTNHGFQQATRLGLHFASLGLSFTHLFSSHLQRATKTAGLIRDAQVTHSTDSSIQETPTVVQLPVLMEQDFGFYEGKKFHERPVEAKKLSKENHRQAHKVEGFVDIESKDSLAQRADAFLDGHLIPLLESATEPADLVVAIVSHGIMLSSLWKRLLSRLPERSVKLAPALVATAPVTLKHLGGWSNTGYLELRMNRTVLEPTGPPPATVVHEATSKPTVSPNCPIRAPSHVEVTPTPVLTQPITPALPAVHSTQASNLAMTNGSLKLSCDWSTVICTINGKDHLKNLKRTGGGVGSSRHDSSQQDIKSFFKRRKVG